MSLGVVVLAHTAFDRAEQVIRHWSAAGCPLVVHVDSAVPDPVFATFRNRLSDLADVSFCRRFRCEWGTWGLVAASQAGAEELLRRFPQVRHVYLASGACLPLRPIRELQEYLAARPQTDFIESATTAEVPWTIGGLNSERFTLRFPFAWKRQRFLFDRYVELQRRIRYRRAPPLGLIPHMGSQWWCLTRRTLSMILEDPRRQRIESYFRTVWIPDESYFQTLARHYSDCVESRSLTLSKFDFQGKPHIFYDDHLQLLRRSDCFVARKIWPHAERLYQAFLTDPSHAMAPGEPDPGRIDRIFARAVQRRTRGRAGLYMQSRFPNQGWENGITAGPYSVFQGFDELFDNFGHWIGARSGAQVHGHLYAPERAEFAGGARFLNGALSDDARLRDYNPNAFLQNLVWNTRGQRQIFMFGPRDNQEIAWRFSRDANAQVSVIAGAWALGLFRSNRNFADLRRTAARLQKIESGLLDILKVPQAKARIRIWRLAEFIEAPMEALQDILDEMGGGASRHLTEAPRMVDLDGFDRFLQSLKNQGMHPYLVGDFSRAKPGGERPRRPRKPYIVR
ncbi:beta-1,6-N-acetylglucosaminyltransferase [Sulfitobacter sp. LCG007]